VLGERGHHRDHQLHELLVPAIILYAAHKLFAPLIFAAELLNFPPQSLGFPPLSLVFSACTLRFPPAPLVLLRLKEL
jgi:hypothetical protein